MRWEIRTRQTCAVVSLMSALADLTSEIEWSISEKGIHMRQPLRHDTILISLHMPAGQFDTYNFEGEPCTLILPTEVAMNVLHTSSITDSLAIMYNSQTHMHKATIELSGNSTTRTFCIPASCSPGVKEGVETRITYVKVLHMHTNQLNHLIQYLLPFSKSFEVNARDDLISVQFRNNQNSCIAAGCVKIGNKHSDKEPYAKGTFSSEAMSSLSKCFGLHQVCNLMIADDAPLVIELEINELGCMKVALMPVE